MSKFYTRYGKRIAVQLEFHFPGLTEQHHKDDCDVNVIIERYLKTGELPTESRQPVFGDFTCGPQDYREAMDLVVQARERFEALPSAIRDRFNNSPEQLLAFLDDPDNADEARRLGLIATDPGAADASARDTTRAGAPAAPDPGAQAEASGEAATE